VETPGTKTDLQGSGGLLVEEVDRVTWARVKKDTEKQFTGLDLPLSARGDVEGREGSYFPKASHLKGTGGQHSS